MLKQPDLSTSIVIFFTILCMIYISGISYRLIFRAAAVGIPLLCLLMYLAHEDLIPFIEPYQVNRVLAFINPEKYADLNLQQDNSKMAIGSGMLYGKGLFNDTAISVKNGNYLSEEHTDFIFSVIGEELGFAGCMLVLLLYFLLCFVADWLFPGSQWSCLLRAHWILLQCELADIHLRYHGLLQGQCPCSHFRCYCFTGSH